MLGCASEHAFRGWERPLRQRGSKVGGFRGPGGEEEGRRMEEWWVAVWQRRPGATAAPSVNHPAMIQQIEHLYSKLVCDS